MRTALLVLDLFVAVTAIGGGIALVSGLEGDRFSVAILRRTPFRSFLVPGLILAIVVGGSAAVAAVAVIADAGAGGTASIVAGVLLSGFIGGEVRLLADQPGWSRTEILYAATGVAMVALGAATWLGA